jgi:acyl-CoA thioesterase FadM
MTVRQLTTSGLTVVAEWASRGDEIGSDGFVSPARILSWLEHGRWQAVQRSDDAVASLFTDGHVAVIRSQRVVLQRPVGWPQSLVTAVGISGLGRTSVEIAQEIRQDTPDGPLVAEARITAVHLAPSPEGRRPTPLPDAIRSSLRDLPEPDALVGFDAHSHDLTEAAFVWQTEVRPSETDLFQHVNHARYCDWFDDARRVMERAPWPGWTTGRRISALALDYVREVLAGETVEVRLCPAGPNELIGEARVGGTLRARSRIRVG